MKTNFDDYIDKLINKDNDAFKVIYEETKKGVFSIIISYVHSKAVTEDLMQDTYIKMIKKIRQYQKGRNFNAWLMQIAKNTALDYLRKSKKEFLYDPQESAYLHQDLGTDPKTYDVLDLVESLDDEDKQVVLMRVVGEYKFKDIAKAVDKPLGTVLWIYQKSLKKLKKELDVHE